LSAPLSEAEAGGTQTLPQIPGTLVETNVDTMGPALEIQGIRIPTATHKEYGRTIPSSPVTVGLRAYSGERMCSDNLAGFLSRGYEIWCEKAR
jgi:hypothetical protein